MKKVLLGCHSFPPYSDIGGRRWAKFAKYLAQKGVEVHVIACENVSEGVSPWQNDVLSPQIKTYFLPVNYPKVFQFGVKNVFDKIEYRILKTYYQTIQNKRVFDVAFLWEKQFLSKAAEVISTNNIKNIVVTGAPFYLLYYAAKLKNKFPHLNYIADYRDPWLGAVNYGIQDLSGKKLRHEQEIQKYVYQQANYITAPNDFLLHKIIDTIGRDVDRNKFTSIEHAYDIDDLKPYFTIQERADKDKIKFVYGGTFYLGTEMVLEELSNLLSKLKYNHPYLYSKLSFEFFTPEIRFSELFKEHTEVVKFDKPIGNKIFTKVASADFSMLFLADHNKDYCTTKFFEMMPFKKPYILLGENGFVAEKIKKENLGYFFKSGSLEQEFIDFLINYERGGISNKDSNPNISNYSYDKLTDKLLGLLV